MTVSLTLPDGNFRLPFGRGLAAPDVGLLLLSPQDAGNCAIPARSSSNVPLVRSGEPVLSTPSGHTPLSVSMRLGSRLPAASGLRLHLDDCRFSPESPFRPMVRETALRVGVEPRTLAVRLLLQLPRVASYNGWITAWDLQRELRITAARLYDDARDATDHLPTEKFPLRELCFEEIEPSHALPVLASLHYLRSARPGSRYFALVDPVDKRPVTLCSVSPLHWRCVARGIERRFGIPLERVCDLSRVYSVDNAPRNAISALLSKVRRYLRQNVPSIDLLVTAVDPNLGFTGSSYRAANWQQWMTVKARPYLYEDGRYVSPRQLREKYGSSNLVELQARYSGRFQQSRVRLLDPMIYCCRINGETKLVLAQDRRRLHR
jgi:hypothetical protein